MTKKKRRWWATRNGDSFVTFWHSVNKPRLNCARFYEGTGSIGGLVFPLCEPPLRGECIEIQYPIEERR
jgi:hypothetical protein